MNTDILSEVWKDIPGWEGVYQVSDAGRVRSLPRSVTIHRKGVFRTRRIKGRVLSVGDGATTYSRVHLSEPGRHCVYKVHSLVLMSFIGHRPPGLEGCHADGDKANNRLTNLRYDTPKGNTADKHLHGTVVYGERIKSSKLTRECARAIRSLRGVCRRSELSKRFGVSGSVISCIWHNKIWKEKA